MSSHRLCIWLHNLNALAIQKDENCSTVQTWGFHGMPWEHANFCCDTDAFGPTGFPDCWDEVHLWLQSLDLSELTKDQVPFFLSVASLLTASKSTVSVSLTLEFWFSVYWKLAQKNVFPMQWYHYTKECKGLPAARWVLLRGYKCIARENDTKDGSENPRMKFRNFRGLSDVHV